MSSSFTNISLSDPSTPLVFLDPETAYLTTVANYVSVGALAVLLWDIMDNASADYHLLFKKRLSLSLVAYFGARVGTVGYMLGSVIFSTAPTGNCKTFDKVVEAFCPVSLTLSSFLFFLRFRAIYNRNRAVVAVFFALLVGLFVATLFVPLGVVGGPIAPTRYCEDVAVSSAVSAGQIYLMGYDTLVFGAISWRLRSVASVELGLGQSVGVMLFGKHLPAFTRSLLLDGQFYYLITLVVGVAANVVLYAPGVPAPLRFMLDDVYLVVVNVMACRVYRRTKMGRIREAQISTAAMAQTEITQIVFRHTRNTAEDRGSAADAPLAFVVGAPPESIAEGKVEV